MTSLYFVACIALMFYQVGSSLAEQLELDSSHFKKFLKWVFVYVVFEWIRIQYVVLTETNITEVWQLYFALALYNVFLVLVLVTAAISSHAKLFWTVLIIPQCLLMATGLFFIIGGAMFGYVGHDADFAWSTFALWDPERFSASANFVNIYTKCVFIGWFANLVTVLIGSLQLASQGKFWATTAILVKLVFSPMTRRNHQTS